MDSDEVAVATMDLHPGLSIAAIVPCHNEEHAVGRVVEDLLAAVPGIVVYVYDNCSTDDTVTVATRAGAIVRREERKGKGNVIRRAFADIDADIYLMIDGDDTYDAHAAPELIRVLLSGPYDHVLGVRSPVEDAESAYRAGHETGNRMINAITGWVFGSTENDMLSGYRVMSRRFVKSFPAVSREFEIETELTVHTLALRVPHTSRTIGFRDRPEGSESKLKTYRDGFKILRLIAQLAGHERPFAVYGGAAFVSFVAGVVLTLPVVGQYLQTQLVPRLPSLVLGLVFFILSALAVVAGIVLDGIRKSRHEDARLTYLQYPAVDSHPFRVHGLRDRPARESAHNDRRIPAQNGRPSRAVPEGSARQSVRARRPASTPTL